MKLTKQLRESITGRVLTDIFKFRRDALQAAQLEAAERLYQEATADFPPDLQAKVPAKYLRYSQRVTVSDPSTGFYEHLRFPENRIDVAHVMLLPPNSAAQGAYVAAEEASKALEQERREIEQTLEALLSSVTTLKRLREVWPEGEEAGYIPLDSARAGRPMIPVSRLNEMLAAAKAAK